MKITIPPTTTWLITNDKAPVRLLKIPSNYAYENPTLSTPSNNNNSPKAPTAYKPPSPVINDDDDISCNLPTWKDFDDFVGHPFDDYFPTTNPDGPTDGPTKTNQYPPTDGFLAEDDEAYDKLLKSYWDSLDEKHYDSDLDEYNSQMAQSLANQSPDEVPTPAQLKAINDSINKIFHPSKHADQPPLIPLSDDESSITSIDDPIQCDFPTPQPKQSPVAPLDSQGTTDIATKPALSQPANLSIQDEVHKLVTGTSQKFVPQPTFDTVAMDAFLALRRFRITARNKEKYRLQRKHQESTNSDSTPTESGSQSTASEDTATSGSCHSSMQIEEPPFKGLHTNLRSPNKCYTTNPGSPSLEMFLKDLETSVLNMVWKYRNNIDRNHRSKKIHRIMSILRTHPEYVVVPTDKTNSHVTLPTEVYINQVNEHLQAHGKKISHTDLTTVQHNAMKLLAKVKPYLSNDEYYYISNSLNSCAIPTPKLLVKDHKPRQPDGQYPTRLIVPASNFVSAFPNLGYRGIKQIFAANNIQCLPRTIIHAADLKSKLETLGLTPDNSTIVSLDAVDYYPSIRFKLVEKAIAYFSKGLQQRELNKIMHCMEMIRFGMNSTYLMFQDSYYQYDGDHDIQDVALSIGAFESAWLADIVGSYLYLESPDSFDATTYNGTYRDDGLVVFPGRKTHPQIVAWLQQFQARVNELADGDYLQYTCELWADPAYQPVEPASGENKSKVKVNTTSKFPYLDMEFSWHPNGQLQFGVHLKPNQQLKYLNKGSSHTSACFKAIPKSVCYRLATLTTMTTDNANKSLRDLYPNHFAALGKAGLLTKAAMPTIPTLSQAKALYKPVSPTKRAQQQRKRDARRTAYFCIGVSRAWTTPIWVIIKNLKKKHGLHWLRVSMSYHKFSNFREILNGDVTAKINANVISKDFQSRECNCQQHKSQGCNYNNHCRDTILVYRVQCKTTGKSYIGCTQQHFKKRMQDHIGDVRSIRTGNSRSDKTRSDTYAKHFAAISVNYEDPSPKVIRNMASYHILWKGNPLSTVKTFRTDHCILCNQERLNLFKWFKTKPDKLINACPEIYGVCKHKPKFHRLSTSLSSSTDESSMDEKVSGRCRVEV